uniref:Coiled-coil domain-containing protein 86 n=1 Tax=Hyaloperonospora arabidopsidis (strain Emoy2) TaxID=559515 RepID=M4B5M6_HYAAE
MTAVKTATPPPPRGRPVSGRVWKKVQKTRFSSQGVKSAKVLSSTWDEKLLKRAKLKDLKELQTDIKTRRQVERDAKRQARDEKEKRRKENELKSASVQVLSRTHRLKTMSKKQLRNIKKTIVNKQGVVEYVPVYSK